MADSKKKHALVVAALILWTLLLAGVPNLLSSGSSDRVVNPWVEYGTLLTLLLVTFKYLSALALPKILTSAAGLVFFSTFPHPVKLRKDPKEAPFLCVRVVTLGLYPELIKYTVEKNLGILNRVGTENFILEVVTNTRMGLQCKDIREIVLPPTYKTKKGSLNRARNLQFCLEEENDLLDQDAWVVHIDEETVLTEDSARGILNFITNGKYDFGQGIITYAGEQQDLGNIWDNFQHHICTVANSFCVALDMGQLRGQLKMFHKPIFGWKGPFIVGKLKSLKEVTFDHGPECSLAEDNFFAMMAMQSGKYKFGFVEGEMCERSAFTMADHFQQRRRWIRGCISMVSSTKIAWKTKIFFATSLLTWLLMPVTVWHGILMVTFPFDGYPLADFIALCHGAVFSFHYPFGYVKQFSISRLVHFFKQTC